MTCINAWTLLASSFVVVSGWFVNSHLNRKHEIAKKRIDHRLEMLKKYMSFTVNAQKLKSLNGFNDVQLSFYLYGQEDEVGLIERMTEVVTTNPQDQQWVTLFDELTILVRDRLRSELGLSRLNSAKRT